MLILFHIAEILTLFVIIKAAVEFVKNCRHTKNGGVYGNIIHSTQHLVALVGILTYNTVNLISYIYYQDQLLSSISDFGIMITKLVFLDMVWLILIEHFVQERQGRTRPVRFKELFTNF